MRKKRILTMKKIFEDASETYESKGKLQNMKKKFRLKNIFTVSHSVMLIIVHLAKKV